MRQSPMSKILSEINNLFNILHDGIVTSGQIDGSNITFTIEIPHLISRLNPSFISLSVQLLGVESIRLEVWPLEPDEETNDIIIDPEEIFRHRLIILSSDVVHDAVRISCSNDDSVRKFSGGHLFLSCSAIEVRDPSNTLIPVSRLDDLCEEYWDEFAKKKG